MSIVFTDPLSVEAVSMEILQSLRSTRMTFNSVLGIEALAGVLCSPTLAEASTPKIRAIRDSSAAVLLQNDKPGVILSAAEGPLCRSFLQT
ncbi:MAG: hypothetical protein MUO76_08840, partial [Anaerolineaceae bacterium]|nr:hypothetical protein [Anaerolineaceae bacterium]